MDPNETTASPLPDDADISPWRVRRSAHLVHDRWLKVRADDCVTAEGVEIARYYVLEYPDWVEVIPCRRRKTAARFCATCVKHAFPPTPR